MATELLTDPPLLFCDEPTTGNGGKYLNKIFQNTYVILPGTAVGNFNKIETLSHKVLKKIYIIIIY